MPIDFEKVEDAPKTPTWDELQNQLGSSDIQYDDSIIKTAGGPMEQAVRSVTDTLFAGSGTINEEYELERHIKEFVEEGRSYVAMEKALRGFGYQNPKIRRVFNKVTGIDPVQAYLDFATYTTPPDAVPRYNYGWGISKDAKADYFFILPFLRKFAVYKLTGLDKEIVFEHVSLETTREELKKFVKDVRAVTPDSLDNDSDIINRVASIQVPETPLAAEVSRLKSLGAAEDAMRKIIDAKTAGEITEAEFDQLERYVQAEDPTEMSSEDQEKQRELEKYKQQQESRTIEDEVSKVKIPQEGFNEQLQDSTKVNMKELTADAYDLLAEISAAVPNYSIEAVAQSVDLIDVDSFAVDDNDHIDTGSISFVVNISDLKRQEEKKALVIMFIVNGRLQYAGKFKGEDNREYALSTPGINAYFDSSEPRDVGPGYMPKSLPGQEQPGPYR